jgi:hypothetical protein
MKSAKFFAFLLLLCTSLMFVNCTPGEHFERSTKEVIANQNWVVDYYYESGDHTSRYTPYTLRFNPDGTLDCFHNTSGCAGTWKTIHDIYSKEVLMISLHTQDQDLMQLNRSWNVSGLDISLVSMKNSSNNTTEFRIRKI